jgi:Domain of unknown function (DUF3883)
MHVRLKCPILVIEECLMDEATLQRLYNEDHVLCLAWFEEHAGTTTTWPKPIREWIVATHPKVVTEKIVLVTQFKGIFKPKWMPYVLSVRSTPKGPYADSPVTYNNDGSWSFRYAREENKGRDGDTLFTNRALQACMDERIPVGVLYKDSERSPYHILGLALPAQFEKAFFLFESYKPGPSGTTAKQDVPARSEVWRPGSAGRLSDATMNAAVECHAVKLAIDHYRDQGYEVTEVGKPYDLKAVKGTEELHVEVKGSTRSVVDVELTINEVRHAREIRTDLYVVDQIRFERLNDGTIRTTGGRVRHWLTWSPADASLSPTRYRYQLPG